MDADNIIMIIVWAGFIAYAMFVSIFKTKKNHEEASKQAPTKAKEEKATYHQAMQKDATPRRKAAAAAPAISADPIAVPRANPLKVPASKPIKVPAGSPIRVPAANPLPEEGGRVTKAKVAAMQPMSPPSVQANEARKELHDKDALRRAIILGQILQPKF